MKNVSCWFAVLVTTLLIRPVLATPPKDVYEPIRLLPGYHYHLRNFDSIAGEILKDKDNGLLLKLDVPMFADSSGGSSEQEINALKSEDLLWLKEQTVNGLLMRAALTKDKRLLICFPGAGAGFWGTVKNDEDVVDVLLMVMTYHKPTRMSPEPLKAVHKRPKLKRRT